MGWGGVGEWGGMGEWEWGAMIAGAKSKNHLITGGGPADQFYECICYKPNFFSGMENSGEKNGEKWG